MTQTNHNTALWNAKLHARLHDPAEKALVLLRDPAGHEGGTSRELHNRLFGNGVDEATREAVKRADWWASASDRPQFPKSETDGRYAKWTQVHFDKSPVLIHPLSGEQLDLGQDGDLRDTDVQQIKDQSLAHHTHIVDAVGTETADDRRRLAMALWRFTPELDKTLDEAGLGELWRFLPADTRVPDHSIWDHLDLTSAFAGAFAADGNNECALLTVSLGPVQDFIAAARTTSDLWAGSHLLSRMAWEAMKVVATQLGPDAIVFPRLRGVAQVDLWLQQDIGLPDELFENQPWKRGNTDANPLFSAALPNRFLAIVPADQAQALAEDITQTVRDWVKKQTNTAFDKILEVVGSTDNGSYGKGQIDEQLHGFPEVHWSVTPYNSLIGLADEQKQTVGDTSKLAQHLAAFYEDDQQDKPGFLGSQAWRLLSKDTQVEGTRFFNPNPGTLYPAVHDLAERSLAAAKTQRPFMALEQTGYRCSLTGTAEWLTDNPEDLHLPPGKRDDTLWARVAEEQPSWARKGEHLGALATLKRLWPTLFVDEIKDILDNRPSRFVVSTHAMALAPSLAKLGQNELTLDDKTRQEIEQCDRAALPRKLVRDLQGNPGFDTLARIPGWLDRQREDNAGDAARRTIEKALGHRAEAYYALILMDGDKMGQWLSDEPELALRYLDAFHPQVRAALTDRFKDNPALAELLESRRPLSPNRHLAISGALGDFSSVVARRVAEDEHMGRVLYAGGDDLLVMASVSELTSLMAALRGAYSGQPLDEHANEDKRDRHYAHDFYHDHKSKRLYMTMGRRATASIGAVIAHHQAPLGHVIKALRAAEQRAKNAGRNAFSIQTIKRGGGDVTLTLPWQAKDSQQAQEQPELEPSNIRILQELSDEMRKEGVSRRAAYNVYEWLRDLPEPAAFANTEDYQRYIQALLHHQFVQQKLEGREGQPIHSRRLARLCHGASASEDADRLENLLSTAEFLARENRSSQ